MVDTEIGADGVLSVLGCEIGRVAGQGRVSVGLRPEALTLADPKTAGAGRLLAALDAVEDLGHEAILHGVCEGPDGREIALLARLSDKDLADARAKGWLQDRLVFQVETGRVLMFGSDGRRLETPVMPVSAQQPANAGETEAA